MLSAPLTIDDSPNSDTLTISHTYSITNFWVLSTNKQRYNCQFYPLGIHSWVAKPATAIRSMPMELSFPRRRTVQTRIDLPIDFKLSNFTNTIAGPAAELRVKRAYHGQTMWLDYEYKSLTNFVPASLAAEHLGSLDRMEDALGYSLTWQNMDGLGGSNGFNWPVFALAAVYAVLLAVGIGLLCRRQCRLASAAIQPPLLDRELNGLGGWLVLVAINLVFGPLRLLVVLSRTLDAYSLLHWHALTAPGGVSYHPAHAPVLTFELLGNITLLILTLFVVVLFFQRRPIFPRWFIVLLLVNAAFMALDAAAMQILKPSSSAIVPGLMPAIVGCCIWIPYMCSSRRVKATFGRSARLGIEPVPRPPPPGMEPVLTNIARPEPPLRHYHGGAHMIFLWLCVLALPLAFLEMNLKNAWTTGVSIAVFSLSVVFAIVAMVKQSNSDMPRTIKSLPLMLAAGIALFLYTALMCGMAVSILEHGSGKKIPSLSTGALYSILSVVFPSLFSCLGFAGLVLLIRYQNTSKKSPSAPPGQNN
jgi:hypothetical protein